MSCAYCASDSNRFLRGCARLGLGSALDGRFLCAKVNISQVFCSLSQIVLIAA